MICQNCGTENSNTARFCKSCGSHLHGLAPKMSASTPTTNFIETEKLQYHDLKKEIEELKVIFDIRVEEMKRISHNIEIMKNNITSLTKKQIEIENQQDFLQEKLERKIKNLEKDIKNDFDSLSVNIKELSKSELRRIKHETEKTLNEKLYDFKKLIDSLNAKIIKNKKRLDDLSNINLENIKNDIASLMKKQMKIENQQDLLQNKFEKRMKNLEKNVKNDFDLLSTNIKELSKSELRKIGQEMGKRLNEKLEERLNSELFEMKTAFKTQTKRMEKAIEANFKENSVQLETFKQKVRDAVNPLLKRLDAIEDRFKELKIDSLITEINENKKELDDLNKLVNQMFETIKKMPTSRDIEESLSKIKNNILTVNTKINVIEDKLKKIESANTVVNYQELKAEVETLRTSLNTIEQSTKSVNKVQSLPESVTKALESNIVASIKGEVEGMINEKFDELTKKIKNQTELNVLAEKKESTPAAEMETKSMPAEIETHAPDQIKTVKHEEKSETVKAGPTEDKKIKTKSTLKEIKNRILEEKKKLGLDTSEDTKPETSNSESEECDEELEGKFICRYCHQPFSSQKILEMHEIICNEKPQNKNVNSEPEDKL
jgi:ribosomal protein L40E